MATVTYIIERVNAQGQREIEADSLDDVITKLQEMGDILQIKNLRKMDSKFYSGYTCDGVFSDGSTKMLYVYEKKNKRG